MGKIRKAGRKPAVTKECYTAEHPSLLSKQQIYKKGKTRAWKENCFRFRKQTAVIINPICFKKKLIIKKCSLSKMISTLKNAVIVYNIPGTTIPNKLLGETAHCSKTAAISPQWLVAKSCHEDKQRTYSSGQNLLSISLISEHKAGKKTTPCLLQALKILIKITRYKVYTRKHPDQDPGPLGKRVLLH